MGWVGLGYENWTHGHVSEENQGALGMGAMLHDSLTESSRPK